MSIKPYIPVNVFRKMDVESILSIALPAQLDKYTERRYDHHHSRRTMLYYLLGMQRSENNEQLMKLVNDCRRNIDWVEIETIYNKLKTTIEPYQKQNNAEHLGTYWELERSFDREGARRSKEYISKYRKNGFLTNELKLYWNYNQIKMLNQPDQFNPDTDQDSHDSLALSPVHVRKNAGKVEYIRSGIEDAVFRVPDDHQVIVLDFADERMPGGYFLENARTQEEVILYNSDGYRALLDLKYKIMDGGYMLPEFGVAYIKNVRFFQNNLSNGRLADLIVAACYDLSGMGEGLYKPPSRANENELYRRTYEKLQTIIASAVANTDGDGSKTYLLLGPIGTGAFANSIDMIAKIFSEILNKPLMNSQSDDLSTNGENAIRYAFKEIWFVSIDELGDFKTHFEGVKSNKDDEQL
ncbi:unnamed protein product [Adineta ricciae]|uniref:Microbial-type PARG catalytic domain-containing protein n=1 Tax=Adineta ricciae TaxID=249248 RepID=A0A815UKZ1_ADIRI|nr:unnamed protein product [Adineta ricciae]CAF1520583.1 unnamed protein product [Adineta ricciae]